jgi:hypothetical protein
MPPNKVTTKNSSSGGTESTPVLGTQRKTPAETPSINDLRRKATEEWNEAEKAIQRMLKNKEVYSNMEELVQDYAAQNAAQKAEAELKQNKIEELESYKKVQLDDFVRKYNEWKETETKLKRDAEIADRNSKRTYSREIENLKADLKTTKGHHFNHSSTQQNRITK